MKRNKLAFLIGVLVFGLFVLFVIISENSLDKNAVLLCAHTTEWVPRSNVGSNLQYEFLYHGISINPAGALFGDCRVGLLFCGLDRAGIYARLFNRADGF